MTFLPRTFLMIAALAAPVVLSASAGAQDATLAPVPKARKAKPAATPATTGERRPGELEGWTTSAAAPASGNRKKLPPGVVSEKALPDGGIPLPAERGNDIAPPIAIDSSGRPAGMFRF